jgi:hypothetical protein
VRRTVRLFDPFFFGQLVSRARRLRRLLNAVAHLISRTFRKTGTQAAAAMRQVWIFRIKSPHTASRN